MHLINSFVSIENDNWNVWVDTYTSTLTIMSIVRVGTKSISFNVSNEYIDVNVAYTITVLWPSNCIELIDYKTHFSIELIGYNRSIILVKVTLPPKQRTLHIEIPIN